MSQLIPVFVTFILFTIVSYLLGSKIIRYVHFKCDVLALPFGYLAFFAIYQIILYPLQLFKINAIVLPYSIAIICVIILIVCFKEIKNIKLSLKSLIYIGVVFVAFMVMYYYKLTLLEVNLTMKDVLFYDSQVNVFARSGVVINKMSPVSGGVTSRLYVIYAFMGGSNFLSGLSSLTKIEPILISNWFLPMLYSALMSTCAYNIYLFIKEYFQNNKLALFILIAETILLLSNDSILYSSYITSLRGYVVFGFCLLLLILYVKTKEKSFVYWFIISNFALISFHSTQVFLIGFYLFSLVVYQIIKKEFDIKTIILLAIPEFAYLFCYILYTHFTIIVFALIVVVIIVLWYLYKIDFKPSIKVLSILLVVVAIAINLSWVYIGNQIVTYDGYDIMHVFKTIFFNTESLNSIISSILYCFYTVLLIICAFKFKDLDDTGKFIIINGLVIGIFFFNPLSAPIISKYILTIAYDRVAYIYFDFIFITLLLLNQKQVLKTVTAIVISCSLLETIVYSTEAQVFDTTHFKEGIKEVDPIYKVGYESMQIGYAIDSNIDVFNSDGYVTMPRFVINSILISNKYRFSNIMNSFIKMREAELYYDPSYFHEMDEKSQIEVMLEDPSTYFSDWYYAEEPDRVPDIKTIMLDSNTDFFVIRKREDDGNTYFRFEEIMSSFATLVGESDNYEIYYIQR